LYLDELLFCASEKTDEGDDDICVLKYGCESGGECYVEWLGWEELRSEVGKR
jgi:hypothetical protein